MRFQLRALLLIAAAAPPMFALAWNMPAVKLASNCGGNNAARAYVNMAAMTMIVFAEHREDKSFSLASATPAQLQELADGCRPGWGVREGDIWVTTKPLRPYEDRGQRVGAVCSRPFRNVPQCMFRQAPPSHAVAYSDGRTALISTREFAALDRSAYMPLAKITPSP